MGNTPKVMPTAAENANSLGSAPLMKQKKNSMSIKMHRGHFHINFLKKNRTHSFLAHCYLCNKVLNYGP